MKPYVASSAQALRSLPKVRGREKESRGGRKRTLADRGQAIERAQIASLKSTGMPRIPAPFPSCAVDSQKLLNKKCSKNKYLREYYGNLRIERHQTGKEQEFSRLPI